MLCFHSRGQAIAAVSLRNDLLDASCLNLTGQERFFRAEGLSKDFDEVFRAFEKTWEMPCIQVFVKHA